MIVLQTSRPRRKYHYLYREGTLDSRDPPRFVIYVIIRSRGSVTKLKGSPMNKRIPSPHKQSASGYVWPVRGGKVCRAATDTRTRYLLVAEELSVEA